MTTAVVLGLGLLIGLTLGALGGGGSILTVPALVYVVGQDPKAATTSSLFIVGMSALVGAISHARSGRVRWRVGVAFGVTGVAASFAGTALNRLVTPDLLLLGFAGLVLVAAAGMFAKSRRPEPVPAGGVPVASANEPHRPAPGRILVAVKVLGAGLVVGFLTGFFGVGGGFVIVPALTLLLGFAMPEAVATSLVVIALNSVTALLARAGSTHFDWAVILPFTATAIVGSLAGKRVADRVRGDTLTRAFAVLLVLVALGTAASSLVALAG